MYIYRYLKRKKPAATYFPALAVSSAQEGLTSVFGMGTGIAPPLWPPAIHCRVMHPGRMPQKRAAPRMREKRGRKSRAVGPHGNGNDNMVKPHGLLVLLG